MRERVEKTVVGIYDVHITGAHPPHSSYLAVKKYIKETRPEVILFGGDFLELDCIRKKRSKYVMDDSETYHADMEAGKRELWDLRVWCPDSRLIYLVGNHEKRIDWFVDDTPAMKGHLDLVKDLELAEMEIEVVPYNDVLTIGKLNYIHGWYWSMYHTKKTLDIFGDNIIYGHVHEFQTWTKNIRAQNQPHIAMSVPCLSAVNPEWKQGQPTRFQNGFVLVEYREKGHFTAHPIIIIDGVFSYGGYIWRA